MSNLTDILKNGVVQQGRQVTMIMVTAESDLADLNDYGYEPGSLAYTTGFKDIWQLGADGTWVNVLEEG